MYFPFAVTVYESRLWGKYFSKSILNRNSIKYIQLFVIYNFKTLLGFQCYYTLFQNTMSKVNFVLALVKTEMAVDVVIRILN